MTLKKITLLSIEEYRKYKPVISLIKKDDWWWLRSPGDLPNYAASIARNGDIEEIGSHVINDDAIRPALSLNLEVSDSLFWYKPEKVIGTKIKYGKYTWTVLDAEFGGLYLLCDNYIGNHRFDSEFNDWNTSELKGWLETEGLKLITN